MEESLLDITTDSVNSDRQERLINRYGSPIARSITENIKWRQYLTCAQGLVVVGGPLKKK